MTNTEMIIGLACMGLQFSASIGALAYGYGVLGSTVKNNRNIITQNRNDTVELFNRMRALESLSSRLEEAAGRWERILSNGLNTKIENIQDRIARLEQRCSDVHEAKRDWRKDDA